MGQSKVPVWCSASMNLQGFVACQEGIRQNPAPFIFCLLLELGCPSGHQQQETMLVWSASYSPSLPPRILRATFPPTSLLPSSHFPEVTSISGSHCGSGTSYYYIDWLFFAKR